MRLNLQARNRWEQIAVINAASTNTKYELPTQGGNLPMDRFIHSLHLRVRLRVTIPSASGPTAINADAPYSLVDHVVVSGFHRLRGQREEIVNLRGPELYQLAKIYGQAAPYSVPASLSITASATNDIDFYLPILFTPGKMPAFKQDEWALDAPNYDSLKLEVYWGDEASIFTKGTNASTFSAYGSSSGSPEIRVYGKFYQAGLNLFRGFVPGRVFRYFTELTGSAMTTTATGVRLFNLPRGWRLRGIMLKAGVKASTTSGNNAYLSLTDTALANLNVYRGLNKSVRLYRDLIDMRQDLAGPYDNTLPSGYGLIDFVQYGMDEEILDLRGLIAGPTGDVDCFVQGDVTGATNQAALAVWEEWRYAAQVAQAVQAVQRK